MTEKTAWADLPNAKYIDLVMDSVKKNPAPWNAAWDAAKAAAKNAPWNAAWDAAKAAAKNAAWAAAKDPAWDAARDAARDAAWSSAYDAILALTSWDDYGYLLEENPEDVKILALLGNQAAILLYLACVALQNIKELEIA